MRQLMVLDLSHNNISGSLPPGLGDAHNLTALLLNDNDINGTLPGEAWSRNLLDLAVLQLQNNSINGTLPQAWVDPATFSSLILLDLRNNQLSGPFPNFTADSRLHKDAPRYAVKWDPPNATELDVRLYLEPMAPGWGLCGNLTSIKVVYNSSAAMPTPGQRSTSVYQELFMDKFPRDCTSAETGSGPSIGVAVGSGLAAAVVVSVLMFIVVRYVRRRRAEKAGGDANGKSGQKSETAGERSQDTKGSTEAGSSDDIDL
eukprot:jgi/Botrbrau1/3238/Bobra.174_1s0011.1